MKVIQELKTFLTALFYVYDEAVNRIKQYLKDRNNEYWLTDFLMK